MLVAQGETAGLFRLSAEHVLPSLDGLREALERPGAMFLDVGAGVGVISSELCMVYPEVAAECLEPNAEARRIGRERVRAAGLGARISFLSHGVEELDAIRRYDLAIVPQPFLSPEAFAAGLSRVGRALRSGGWLLVLALDVSEADPVSAASSRVRARLWGGGAVSPGELLELPRGRRVRGRRTPIRRSAATGCSPRGCRCGARVGRPQPGADRRVGMMPGR